jgi:3-dehydroquinate dehydratase/shikimate dehydrogenase
MPLICVSLGVDDPQRLRAEHAALVATGCRLVEYRLDFLPPATDVAELIRSRPGPIIATVRRPEDGGKWLGPEDERRRMLQAAIDAGADYVDLEPDAAIAIPRRGTTRRIVSMHDFAGTPPDLAAIHARLAACDADVVKLATTATSPVDNFRMLQLVRDAKVPTVGLCMGELGQASRVLNGVAGSPFSFAAANEAAAVAPGQLSFATMRELYRYESLSSATIIAAVIGDPIGHSKSPLIHNRALAAAGIDGVYVAFRVPPDALDAFVDAARAFGFRGLSVTIPHKEAVQKHVTRLDRSAATIGAVNTLVFEPDGSTAGYNTDEPGALDSIEAAAGSVRGRRAFVLGAGGAAKGIAFGLVWRGATVTIANRNRARADELATALGGDVVEWSERHAVPHDVLVNCTSLGMHPKVEDTPFDAPSLRPGTTVFDTVYNPQETRLLREAQARGCRVIVGTEMFVRQAAWQFRYFFGTDAPLDVMHSALRTPHSTLFLIGYRGTGKTSTAKILAARLGWDWLDADVELERRAGKSIKSIFEDDGEQAFRDLESAVLADAVKLQRTIVAAGGGVILREANRALLKQGPRVVWLRGSPQILFERITHDATTAGRRPNLTAGGGLDEVIRLVALREPWYRECAHLTLDTDAQAPPQVAEAVAAWLAASPVEPAPTRKTT